MKNEVLYEDDLIKVVDTGRDYDFIAYIENKALADIEIEIFGLFDYLENIKIRKGDWVGILANDEGLDYVESLKNGQFNCIR